jgi:hypothetical protein
MYEFVLGKCLFAMGDFFIPEISGKQMGKGYRKTVSGKRRKKKREKKGKRLWNQHSRL